MKLRYVIPLSLLCVSLLNGISYPEISQFFDSEGSTLRSGDIKVSPPHRVQRYSIPEGIILQKDIRYEFYPVFGRTFSDIVRSAEENCPIDLKNKKRLPARFVWSAGWDYKVFHDYEIDEEDDTVHADVEIFDINITYNITITLPTLIDDSALNHTEKDLWKNYYRRLVEYTDDHARIIRDKEAQAELRKKFSEMDYVIFDYSTGLDIGKTVETFIQKETEKTGREWIKNLKKKIDEYDRATEYGLDLQKRDSFFSPKEK
jgi:hypothetical protein